MTTDTADLAHLRAHLHVRGCHTTLTAPGPYLTILTPSGPPLAVSASGCHFYLTGHYLIGPRTDPAHTADTLTWALRAQPAPPDTP